jgi:hypothetical protein
MLVAGLSCSSVVCRAVGTGKRRGYDVLLCSISGEHCLIVEVGNMFALLRLRDDWTAQQVRPWLNQTVETLEGVLQVKVTHRRIAVGDTVRLGDVSFCVAGIDEGEERAQAYIMYQNQRRTLWKKDSERINGVHVYAAVEEPHKSKRGRIIMTFVHPPGLHVHVEQGQ